MDALGIGSGPTRQVFPLRGNRVTIGRAPDNDIQITSDLSVSRQHAVLELSPDGWRVRDLRSSNGTFINGARVTTLAKLQPGDSIVMGRARLTLLADNDSVGPEPTMRPASEVDRVGLTSRETEVLRLVAAGRSDAQIAQRIFISVRTVHSHLEHIRNKTGVRRRTELARYAVTLGLSE